MTSAPRPSPRPGIDANSPLPRHDPPCGDGPRDASALLDALSAPPLLSAMPLADRAAVIALRRGLRSGSCPAGRIAAMTEALGGGFAAMRFQLLIEALGAAWPEAFLVRRPCCRFATPDESVLAALLGQARRADRPAFDALLCEMIGEDARDLVWAAARGFVRMDRS